MKAFRRSVCPPSSCPLPWTRSPSSSRARLKRGLRKEVPLGSLLTLAVSFPLWREFPALSPRPSFQLYALGGADLAQPPTQLRPAAAVFSAADHTLPRSLFQRESGGWYQRESLCPSFSDVSAITWSGLPVSRLVRFLAVLAARLRPRASLGGFLLRKETVTLIGLVTLQRYWPIPARGA